MSMSISETEPGDMIVFARPTAGFHQDIKRANDYHLVVGQEYRVSSLTVHSFSTEVRLVGFGSVSFNSCMFDNTKKPKTGMLYYLKKFLRL